MKCVTDTHCHTIASGHAYSTVDEYAREASKKGLELIAITDHAPKTPGMFGDEIYFLNLHVIPKILHSVEVLTGVELNILNINGDIDLREEILRPLDVVIASLHDVCITPSSSKENTKAVINTIKNPLVRIIGHLGDPAFSVNVKDIVNAAKDYNCALEINEASGLGYRSGGDETVLKMAQLCKEKKVPITWGSDAHFYSYVGEFNYVRKISRAAGLNETDVLNTSAQSFKDFLSSGK